MKEEKERGGRKEGEQEGVREGKRKRKKKRSSNSTATNKSKLNEMYLPIRLFKI